MHITRVERLPEPEMIERLRATRLRGHGQPEIYRDARIEVIEHVDPDELVPAQAYVLKDDFTRIESLYHSLLEHGVDIFKMRGGALFWVSDADTGVEDGPVPLIPPVVEESREPDGRTVRLINDGMHRVYAARRLGQRISIVSVRDVPAQYPYYAYPLAGGWAEVVELDAIPDTFVKKRYRDPENYKALFRDFNGIFPGVQKQRKSTHLVRQQE